MFSHAPTSGYKKSLNPFKKLVKLVWDFTNTHYDLYALQSTVHLGRKNPQATLNNQNENNSS